ncbi:hypothetical protein BST61_g2925 [Cercospora zeina]
MPWEVKSSTSLETQNGLAHPPPDRTGERIKPARDGRTLMWCYQVYCCWLESCFRLPERPVRHNSSAQVYVGLTQCGTQRLGRRYDALLRAPLEPRICN